MLRKKRPILVGLLLAAACVLQMHSASSPQTKQQAPTTRTDSVRTTTKALKYPVSELIPQTAEEVNRQTAIDLKDPANIKTTIEYNPELGDYQIRTRLGETDVTTPINLTEEEYQRMEEERSAAAFWKEKNKIDFSKKKEAFSLTDLQFDIPMGDKIFGEGGVRLRTQGSVEVKFGLRNNIVDNPSLSEAARNRTDFDFDQNIQMSVNGKVGDKIDVNLNYDTEATFDYDAKSIKLRYDGKEDEIIKNLEAGNVSMPVNSSLISGGTSLFGIKTELQFGKLSLAAVLSQQQSQTKSVNLSGGVQTSEFEVKVDAYDENRHYFLSHYFRNNYDSWMSNLPYISSGIVVTKVEVWVTNKTSQLENARNIVAFADMGEPETIFNSYWRTSNARFPDNSSNSLYNELLGMKSPDARNFSQTNEALEGLAAQNILIGKDFERLESARRLESSEFTLNPTLGYISLRQALNSDEILAVAFEYTRNGQTYQVGEFSTDGIESPKTLFVKMLKGTDYSPSSPTWDLMMKNVYSTGAYNLEPQDFELKVTFKNDTLGTYTTYLTEGAVKNELLLRVMKLDRLNSKQEPYPDGVFDYVEGYTVLSNNGRIIFPVLEPFGSYLRNAIGNNAIADRYVFEELYDSTLTVAQQLTEKNKFLLNGSYKAASGSAISLGANDVALGSVTVTAGGQKLTENVDYTVDYSSGTVTILNEALIASGTAISASCEDQATFSMIRKTMAGITADYKFSDNFSLGGTLMRLSETPLTTKVDMGYESVNNTIWGLNTSFSTRSQWLTNLIDKLPFIEATQPSQLTVKGEVAQLIAGSSKTLEETSYVDDFEAAKKTINLKDITQWYLASTPYDPAGGLFPEARLTNDLRYGYNRSLLSWYVVDGIFNQNISSQTPGHIRNDQDQLSNHYVRSVNERELFPDRDQIMGQTARLAVMNLAFYPKERGPYNFDLDGMNPDGTLQNPQDRWGGIMRRIESGYTNFEANNVEYIEFWMLDPFVYDTTSTGGDFYINLGEISEDVLKDGKRSFENGLSISPEDTALIRTTAWGKVSGKTSTAYAFDNTAGVRDLQDVGLDGLTTEEEFSLPGASSYVNGLRSKLQPDVRANMEQNPFSPLNDPAGDNYHYFRGSDYDARKATILERYKHYNGTEGNSQSTQRSGETYSTAATTLPNVEDINLDFTLNESERYYQYRISLRPGDMEVGRNFINDKRTATVTLANKTTETVTWYQFKVPVSEYEKRVGTISGFNSIRFIRLFMNGFQDSTILRLATFDLVRGDWRNYTKDLYSIPPTTDASVDVSTVSLQENSGRTPIPYKLPPGVKQESDPSQPGQYFEDEQSLTVRIKDMSPGDARAVYKNTSYDFRQYERLQMFVHAEAFVNDLNPPKNYEMTVFLRLGTDYQNNYYEYEIPLEITDPAQNSPRGIWPDNNFFDIPFALLTKLKTERNRVGAGFAKEYFLYDEDHPQNRVSIVGNPSLADVKTIMVGIRNKSTTVKSVEIWVNELRLSGFREDGGWAALGSAVLALSDLGTVTASGKYLSDGFGGLEQSVSERRMNNYGQYNMALNMNLGRIFPEKAKVNIPLYYSMSNEQTTPKYDPLNEDLLLEDVLESMPNKRMRDSVLSYSQQLKTYKSISLNNVKVDLKSKVSMPYDPANFTFNYSSNEAFERDATTEYEVTKNYTGGMNYAYSSPLKPWKPFASSEKLKSPWLKLLKEFNLNPLPNSLTVNSNLMRYYYELQSRDLTTDASSAGSLFPLTVSKNFLWNTDLNLNWSITQNLRLTYNVNNRAVVEETLNSPVNKELFATEYQNWKDTVSRSLREFGSPLKYEQMANLTWQIPFNKIPLLDFLSNTNAAYSANYTWDRSSTAATETDLGNQIANQRSLSLNATANMMTLYNKWTFLKDTNKRFDAAKKPAPARAEAPKRKEAAPKGDDGAEAGTDGKTGKPVRDRKATAEAKNPAKAPAKEPKKYEVETPLFLDSAVIVKHNLKNRRVYVVAVDSAGKKMQVRMRVKDENSLAVTGSRSTPAKVVVYQKPPLDDEGWYRSAQVLARALMSVRNVSVTYKENGGTTIPGFIPQTNLFSNSPEFGMAPGWDFALGLQGDDYLNRIYDKGWLISDSNITTPAYLTSSTDLRVKSSLEPIKGLKIELSGAHTYNYNTKIQYMFEGMPEVRTGSFTMTSIAIASSFEPSNAKNGYASAAFDRFLENRTIVADRLQRIMQRKSYPSTGFLAGSPLAGQPYDASNGAFDQSSADVMIPAFLAAYTGRDAKKASLDLFPSFAAMLPNWSINFDGLNNLDFIKKKFRSVTLSHAYVCTYNVASFSSFNTFINAGDGLGFVRDVLTGSPMPSSIYDVSAVTLNESFNPLIRVQATLKNGWTFKSEVRKNRNLSLSVAGGQIVEANQDQIVVGTNYKIADFHPWGVLSNSKIKNDLSLTGNLTYKNQNSLLRKIQDHYTQASSGNKSLVIELLGDYVISRNMNLTVFYDLESTIPLVSSYPVTSSDFGFSLRFTLNR